MPDIRQQIDDIREAIEAAIDHRQANTWTTVVAKVVEFDKEKMTGKLQPLVKSTVLKPGGETERDISAAARGRADPVQPGRPDHAHASGQEG